MALVNLGGDNGQSIAFYAAIFDQHWPGQGVGAAYSNYAAQHSNASPYQAAQGFLLIIATKGLAAALQQFATAVGTGTAQATTGIGAGLASSFSVFPNLGTWFIRGAQILLGLVLVAVGVAKLTGAVPVATQVAKTAGAVALA